MHLKHLITLVGLLVWADLAVAKPLVLASIKPLALIAQEIAGTQAEVGTLVPATGSHHDYPLKVSDHSRLRAATLVLWVGPELESFLQKPLAGLPQERLLSAYTLPGLFWPPDAPEEAWHHHDHDPHLWLDPRNAVKVAQALTDRLVQLDAANASIYRHNMQQFAQKMAQLDGKLLAMLKPVAGQGFAVYHEGYSHFVAHYGLRQLSYVTFTPEQKPGAKHLAQLRQDLAKEGKCLFLEPYNDMESARALARELHLTLGTLDALGDQNITSYSQLLEQMAAAFVTCLATKP